MVAQSSRKTIKADSLRRALLFAGLTWSKLHIGTHPDDGSSCPWLEADIKEYSAFLIALAMQYRTADELSYLADHVQVEHDSNGDTRFWLPGLVVED